MTGLICLACCSFLSAEETLSVKVGPFGQEVAEFFAASEGLPDSDVRSLAVARDGVLYAATGKGLARFDGSRWAAVQGLDTQAVDALAADSSEEGVWAVFGRMLFSVGFGSKPPEKEAELPSELGTVHALCRSEDVLWLGTDAGLFSVRVNHGPPVSVAELSDELGNDQLGADTVVADVATRADGRVAVAARSGLFLRDESGQWDAVYPNEGDRSWAPRGVRAVTFDGKGRLWFASPQGVGVLDGSWKLYAGADGLPYNDFTALFAGADGATWFGTHLGAIRYYDAEWAYRQSRRWLPEDDVRDVVMTSDGAAWFATSAGVSVIRRQTMTLVEKARFYEDEIDKRHRRTPYGYVYFVKLKNPGDTSDWSQVDSDNDGQWTGMYGAAECFAYAATKDPKAKERATAAFEAMRFLTEVTQGGSHPAPKGFPARTILPTSGPDPNEQYTLEKDQRSQKGDALWKAMHPRWPTSADGQWYWKCDTSSDELDGHYFMYARYYDLVAETPEEKERVREVVRNVTDHLVANDFHLIDWDGKPTRWANFSPSSLNRDPNWWPERGLNSMSILAYLRIAERVTGDAKYGAVAEKLMNDEAYAQNVMYPKMQRGPGSYVQFDDEMAFMNYYSLVRYESDPKWRSMFASSCSQYWELEECEQDSFYNFAYAACCQGQSYTSPWGTDDLTPKAKGIIDAVDTLKRYPLNLVNWPLKNSHRLDIVPLSPLVRGAGEAEGLGCRVNGDVIPVEERYQNHWSDDAWQLDTGSDGRELATGVPFLLAYYMGLYHGFIQE